MTSGITKTVSDVLTGSEAAVAAAKVEGCSCLRCNMAMVKRKRWIGQRHELQSENLTIAYVYEAYIRAM